MSLTGEPARELWRNLSLISSCKTLPATSVNNPACMLPLLLSIAVRSLLTIEHIISEQLNQRKQPSENQYSNAYPLHDIYN